MTYESSSVRQERSNAIRILSATMVEQANSGHPGAPLGMADMAEVLWSSVLNHSPQNPNWFNRDRFILSNGHASALLYSLLHLTGYDVSSDDLMNFRQLHSLTPGHPEHGLTPGVESTTGPLGQGLSMATGMALAEKILAVRFNTPSISLVNHWTYAFVGDGCLMEGISHEAASLAGTLNLGKLIVLYDSNGISIEGKIHPWYNEDVGVRFQAYGWQVIHLDGHDPEAMIQALHAAKANFLQPSLLICRTKIGRGVQALEGSEAIHGAPIGTANLNSLKQSLNWPLELSAFEVPDSIYALWDQKEKGKQLEGEWIKLWQLYQSEHPKKAEEFERRINRQLPAAFEDRLSTLAEELQDSSKQMSTRQASHVILNSIASQIPEIFGSSADLAHSNLCLWDQVDILKPNDLSPNVNFLHAGVREFGMFSALNGMALHGGFISFGGTFLSFLDYAKPAMRLSALMELHVIYLLTHDSIGVGEDGPTHQPIEQISMIRSTPQIEDWRPCDIIETTIAWKNAICTQKPTALILSRQTTGFHQRSPEQIKAINQGAYILHENTPNQSPQLILMASGSEVALAIQAAQTLSNIAIRVVSVPSFKRFLTQTSDYRDMLLPPDCKKRMAIEAASPDLWWQLVGLEGDVIGINTFGLSGKAEHIFSHFGFTVPQVVERIKKLLQK